MLRSLKITGFFGQTNKNIEINFNSQLTILVGRNGTGKTTILNILNAIITRSFWKLAAYNFKDILLISDEGHIKITKSNETLEIKRLDIKPALDEIKSRLIVSKDAADQYKNFLEGDEQLILGSFLDPDIEKDFVSLPKSLYIEASLEKVKSPHYRDLFNQFPFSIKSLYFPTYRRLEQDFSNLLLEVSPLSYKDSYSLRRFHELLEFIEERASMVDDTIIGFSNKDIEQLIAKKWQIMAQYEKNKLHQLISQFFQSLLNFRPNFQSSLSEQNLESELISLFTKTGLMDKSNEEIWKNQIKKFSNNLKKKKKNKQPKTDEIDNMLGMLVASFFIGTLLDMYSEANKEIEVIKQPFNLLISSLTDFLVPKIVTFTDGALRFEDGDVKLTFENLSAGEKQLVSLFVYTQLALDNEGIVLVDEPELSLHVSWQRKLLTSLSNGSPGLQYIVSTHSPFIISSHRNNVVNLEQNWEYDYE